MGIVTLTSLCFVGVLSMMYLDEKNQLEQAKKEEVSQVAVEAVALQNEPQDIESILAQKEIEVTLSMKEKMKTKRKIATIKERELYRHQKMVVHLLC